LGAVLQAASGRIKNDKRQARLQWLKQLSEAETAAAEISYFFSGAELA